MATGNRGSQKQDLPTDCSLKSRAMQLIISILMLGLGSVVTLPLWKSILISSSYHYYAYPEAKPCNCSHKTDEEILQNSSIWHSMSDEDLLQKAAETVKIAETTDAGRPPPKLAFMFLTRGKLPLRPLWEKFFQGINHQLFSIYIHTSPNYSSEPPQGSVFFGHRIPSKQVEWGRASMMEAERRLLANALLDPSNEWFILLSEACIPLYNFTFVYNYITNSSKSYIESYDQPGKTGRGRYNKRMSPIVTLQDWRKGSQWFTAHRRLAVTVVTDGKYFPVFAEHCQPPCYMDEHYVPTLVTKLFPELNSNRTLTWVDWTHGGSHPAMFKLQQISEGLLLDKIRNGSSKCMYNREPTSVCFLFARKFEAGALGQLLRFAF